LSSPDLAFVTESFKSIDFDGHSMNSVRTIYDLLLSKCNQPKESLKEAVTPVLTVLCRLSRHHRPIRKYLRGVVLPPLRNLNQRPEEGDTARSRLCKMLTSPVDTVAPAVAEFLFILCKESVARLVKYTGYGNAAGLLARRGLMLGGKGADAGTYSDDEEDSETEEYVENVHK
jgi:hypothetical protein